MNRVQKTFVAGMLVIGNAWGMGGTPAKAQQLTLPSYARPGFYNAYGYYPYSVAPRPAPASSSYIVYPGARYHAARSHDNVGEHYRDWTTGRTNVTLLSKPWLLPLK